MTDISIAKTASWLDGTTPIDKSPNDIWARVEIFGHRSHTGKLREIEILGVKMLRIDVPIKQAAPLLKEEEIFETFIYGGAAIFSIIPMTEEAAREHAKKERSYGWSQKEPLQIEYDESERYDE
ncbi:MAG: hypothetical protein KGJ90_00225 [Patescibacteria group bacterium]|nr:hypothetical protein [Patescibacteria group bacterium]